MRIVEAEPSIDTKTFEAFPPIVAFVDRIEALPEMKKYSGRKRRYRRTIGTVDGCRTAGGRSSDGRRTVVGGARVVSGA